MSCKTEVYRLIEAYGQLSMSLKEISRALGHDKSNIAFAIKKLEQEGVIKVKRKKIDTISFKNIYIFKGER